MTVGLLSFALAQFPQRSVINIDSINLFTYAFINHYLQADSATSPSGSAFSTGTPWPALIDANGWPNQPGVSGTNFGGGLRVPGADEFTGPYVMTWDGSGWAQLTVGTWTPSNLVTPGTGTFTNGSASISFANSFSAGQQVVFTSTGTLPTNFSLLTVYYVIATGLSGSAFQVSATKGGAAIVAGSAGSGTQTVNGTFTFSSSIAQNTFDTISPYVIMSVAGTTGPQLFSVNFQRTDPNSTGHYLKNFRFYRQADEADLLAGLVFRAPFKQPLVNLRPSAIRFVEWHCSSSCRPVRFESRTLPTNAGYSYFANWTASPSYGTGATASTANKWTCPAAVTTTGNSKTTPASLTHGEVASIRFDTASTRDGARANITTVSNASPGRVTCSSAHGFTSGDKVIHWNFAGMTNLLYYPVFVKVIDSTHYDLYSNVGLTTPVDTTAWGTYSGSFGSGVPYWEIDIGSRGSRPIGFQIDSSSPASLFYTIPSGGDYQTLYYDKNQAYMADGAGNLSFGVWMIQNENGWDGQVPIEICTTLINEVNALATAQGATQPINMWMNMSHKALQPQDPDYSSASDYIQNAVDVIMNPASVQRTVGYSALTSKASLFIEYSNETWNTAGGFESAGYLARMGTYRWPSQSATDFASMYTLRSVIMMRNLQAAYPSFSSRIKGVLSGAGFFGYAAGGLNELRVDGTTFYNTDVLNTWGTSPIANHDVFATATYFDPGATYCNGQFSTDSSNYAGGNPTSQATAIASFVAEVKSNPAADGQPIDFYLNDSLVGQTQVYSAALKALGKIAINYEGGADWDTTVGGTLPGGHSITSADSLFLIAILDSTQWRDAQVNYFNRTSQIAGSAMPSVFTYTGIATSQRWAYTSPDSYGGTATEGQGLLNSPVWVGMGARNQGLT